MELDELICKCKDKIDFYIDRHDTVGALKASKVLYQLIKCQKLTDEDLPDEPELTPDQIALLKEQIGARTLPTGFGDIELVEHPKFD